MQEPINRLTNQQFPSPERRLTNELQTPQETLTQREAIHTDTMWDDEDTPMYELYVVPDRN